MALDSDLAAGVTEVTDGTWLWLARTAGAVAGSARGAVADIVGGVMADRASSVQSTSKVAT